jgi:hypothetical protein
MRFTGWIKARLGADPRHDVLGDHTGGSARSRHGRYRSTPAMTRGKGSEMLLSSHGCRTAVENPEKQTAGLRKDAHGYRGAYETGWAELALARDERDPILRSLERLRSRRTVLLSRLRGHRLRVMHIGKTAATAIRHALRRLVRRHARRTIEALQSELTELRKACRDYKRINAEVGVSVGQLRDERDQYKLQWEIVCAELRRPTPQAARALLNGHRAPVAGGASGASHAKTAGTSALRILCVGTGRDGTTSLSRIMQDVFDHQGSGELARHEWASRELNMLFCDWRETKDRGVEDRIRELIMHCPCACAIGNGYAAVLPIVAEVLGDQVTLVHLRRRDRAACIASLAENAELSPQNHLYYANSPAATSKRPAAFHFGEMSREQWTALPLSEKFGWYYDKTHALIEQHKRLFTKTLSVDTEDLNDAAVRALLAHAAGSEETPRAFHVNRFVDLRYVPLDRHSFVQRLLGQLDVQKLAHDDLYGLREVLNEFVYHMSHFPDQAPGALDELRWTLTEAHRLLDYRLNDLQELMDRAGVPAYSSRSDAHFPKSATHRP